MIASTYEEITKGKKPEKKLVRKKSKSGGRNATGRITAFHRGGGNKRRYRVIDFKRDKEAKIEVTSVRTISAKGKLGRRVGNRPRGKKKDFKKAVVTLAAGQMLEDYGV